MNVSLTPELESLVEAKVRSGRYASASEVVRDALRLLEDRDREREQRLAGARARVAEGLDDEAAGRVSEGEAVFERLAAKSAKARRRK